MGAIRKPRLRRFAAPVLVAVLAAGPAVLAPAPLHAQQGVAVTTPYPAVSVGPGQSVSFDLDVRAPSRQRVGLRVTERPRGWRTQLRGGGFVVDGVFAGPRKAPPVTLEVEVPGDVEAGVYRVEVAASGPGGTDVLQVRLRVDAGVRGGLSLATEFPLLRGPSDGTFTFGVDLSNDTPEEVQVSLEAAGPQGWQVQARPTGERQAATATVPPGGEAGIEVEVDPPDDTPAGVYPVVLRAAGAGKSADLQLEVEITGNFALTLTTPDERLNADVRAGETARVPLLVVNEGTAPLVDVSFSSSPPSGWEVEFQPERVAAIPPGETATVVALITPSEEAIAGDYVVTLRSNSPETSDQIDLRATVRTSPLWGLVGVLLMGAALGGLGWVFRRYGRR